MRRYYSKLPVAGLLVAFGWTIGGGASAAAQDHARILPTNTIFCVQTDSSHKLSAAWSRTQLAKLSEVPQLNSIAREFIFSVGSGAKQPWRDVDLEELWDVANAGLSYSILETPEGKPALVLLIDDGEEPLGLHSFFSELPASLSSAGWRTEAAANELPSGVGLARFTLADGAGAALELVIGRWNERYCLATDWAVALSLAQRDISGDTENSLQSKEAYHAGLASIQLAAPDLLFYADPIELAQVYQADPNDGIDPRVVAADHGFNAIQGVMGKVSLSHEAYDVVYELAVHVPQPHTLSMPVLAFKNHLLDVPAWLPDYLHTMERIEIDLTQFLHYIAGPFDDLVSEGTLQEILEDMKASDGPGVDLETELFGQFAPTVWLLSESSFPATRTSERTVLCVQLKDAKRVAEAIYRLLKDDPNSQANRIPGQANVLWKFGLQEASGPNFSSSGLMVANDCLFIASNIDAIRKLILTANGTAARLRDAQDLKSTFEKLDAMAGTDGFLRLFIRIDRDVRSAYELLRAGQVSDSESMYAQLLAKAIESTQNSGKTLPDFSTLPEFEEIEPYLGIGTAHGRVVENGWQVTGFVKRK